MSLFVAAIKASSYKPIALEIGSSVSCLMDFVLGIDLNILHKDVFVFYFCLSTSSSCYPH